MDFSSANVKELKSLLSGVLGYAILAGSFLLKVPQIRNICASASVEGSQLPFSVFCAGIFFILLIACT